MENLDSSREDIDQSLTYGERFEAIKASWTSGEGFVPDAAIDLYHELNGLFGTLSLVDVNTEGLPEMIDFLGFISGENEGGISLGEK